MCGCTCKHASWETHVRSHVQICVSAIMRANPPRSEEASTGACAYTPACISSRYTCIRLCSPKCWHWRTRARTYMCLQTCVRTIVAESPHRLIRTVGQGGVTEHDGLHVREHLDTCMSMRTRTGVVFCRCLRGKVFCAQHTCRVPRYISGAQAQV